MRLFAFLTDILLINQNGIQIEMPLLLLIQDFSLLKKDITNSTFSRPLHSE
jgi:hypothetical protein